MIIYLLIIALAYILIQRLQVYFSEKYSINKSILYAKIASMTIILCLFISFILTSINIGEGIFKGKFIKEMYFPAHHIRLYIYDYSFSNSLTSIKVKDRTWPVMEKLSFIENSSPFELKIWRHSDTVVFTGKDIKLIYDLRQRKGKKIYYKQSSDNKARL